MIRISFGAGVLHTREALDAKLTEQLDVNQEALGLTTRQPTLSGRFSELIRVAHAQYGQRVVELVDEYDKPILDNITDEAVARQMRDGLRSLYSVIKDADAQIKFAMLTGVSKFSKVSLFSGLNDLNDITVSSDYSALCGYTDADVDTVFTPELGRMVASETLLSTFDVDQMSPEALLFQTGYLTIASVWSIPGRQEFTLKYPNLEVQSSLNDSLRQPGGTRPPHWQA